MERNLKDLDQLNKILDRVKKDMENSDKLSKL